MRNPNPLPVKLKAPAIAALTSELGFAVNFITCRVGPAGTYQDGGSNSHGPESIIVIGHQQPTVDFQRAKSILYCLCGQCIASSKESAVEQLRETQASAEQNLANLNRKSQRCDFGCLISFVILLVSGLFIFQFGSTALAPAALGATLALALGLFTATKGEEAKSSLPELGQRTAKAAEYAAICSAMKADDFFAAAFSQQL